MAVYRCDCGKMIDLDWNVEDGNVCPECEQAKTGKGWWQMRCMDCHDSHRLEEHGIEPE